MGVFVPCANTLLVKFKGTIGDRNCDTIVAYQYSGTAPAVSDVYDLAATLGSAWVAQMLPLQTPQFTLESVEVTDLTSASSAQSSVVQGISGTRVGDPVGAQVACLINYSTDVRWRGGHPRQYLAVGVTTDLASVQTWNPGFLTAVETAWIAVYTVQVGSSVGPATLVATGFVSRKAAKVPRDPHVFFPFTGNAFTVNATCATQRRRTRRR